MQLFWNNRNSRKLSSSSRQSTKLLSQCAARSNRRRISTNALQSSKPSVSLRKRPCQSICRNHWISRLRRLARARIGCSRSTTSSSQTRSARSNKSSESGARISKRLRWEPSSTEKTNTGVHLKHRWATLASTRCPHAWVTTRVCGVRAWSKICKRSKWSRETLKSAPKCNGNWWARKPGSTWSTWTMCVHYSPRSQVKLSHSFTASS